MTEEEWRRAAELFDAALEVPAERRAEWLAERTAGDPELAAEVEALLAAHGREEGLLDRPLPTPGEIASPSPVPADDVADRLQAALGDRYEIVRELGRGGMSVVLLAWERKHDRRVVFKVLKPEIAAVYGSERFLREVRIASGLSHPHILGLIDSGEAAGLLYYVMPHVQGETLRDRLERRGPLPVGEALILLRDVASALAYAHDEGVIHRDLKPDNVLCAGDHAFLMDFGVAKPLAAEGEEALTRTGGAVGTPRYMAPEQLAGRSDVDHRADLYAWGLLAYEMLTGEVHAISLDRLDSAQVARDVSLEIRGARPEAPRHLSTLIGRCLAIDPRLRPEDASGVLRSLDEGAPVYGRRGPWRILRTAAAAGVALVAAGGWWWWQTRDGTRTEAALPTPVAVAAFTNETGIDSLDALGRLAGDWLTQGLIRTGLPAVVPWPTALAASRGAEELRAEGRSVDLVAHLGRETGARAVVTGSFYRIGAGSLQFRAEVTDVLEGRILAATEPIVVPAESASAGIRRLRGRVMGSLAVAGDERLADLPGVGRNPPTWEAYRAFDRGLRLYLDQEYREAAPEFLAAYAADSTFSTSLLYAATVLFNAWEHGRVDSLLSILEANAAGLDPYQELRLRWLRALLSGDGPRALRLMAEASAMAPDSRSLYNAALAAVHLNRPGAALEFLARADPDRGLLRGWAQYWTVLAHAHHLLGDHEAELEAARTMRRRHPDRRLGGVLEARALAAAGRLAELERLAAELERLSADTYWSAGAALTVAGEERLVHAGPDEARPWFDRAVRWLEDRLRDEFEDHRLRYWLASALYGRGDFREAGVIFEALAREDPDRLAYRGSAAVCAARLRGREAALALLGSAPAWDRGRWEFVRARIEAVAGRRSAALEHLRRALQTGVDGFAWLQASAWHDFEALRDDPEYVRLMAPGSAEVTLPPP